MNLILCLLATGFLSGSSIVPEPARHPLALWSPVQDKNFYLLSVLERNTQAQKALAAEPTLAKIARDQLERLEGAFQNRSLDQSKTLLSMLITPEEVTAGAEGLRRAYENSAVIRDIADRQIPLSGTYYQYQLESGPERLARAWKECAEGINNAILVYGTGRPGRSADIDSMFYKPTDPVFNGTVHNLFGILLEDTPKDSLFCKVSLRVAIELMEANRRNEAGRHEPMERGENQAAFRAIPRTAWKSYPYTVMVVPGLGPDEPGVALSPAAKLILSAVARRYREKKAPFILVSGGYVHPNQTPFCEAIEMKRSLIKDFGIPERAIIIDPHARHTTTNMRNVARLMYRYGIPFDRPGLVTTNTYQSADIEGPGFRARCQRVFGYVPYSIGERLSPFDLEFTPKIESLRIDPKDPLDP
ncbi:MAG: YdcF family protein [Fimbriimonas sp.]